MTDATCRPVATPLTVWGRERQADRMTELLECLADLLVHTAEQRATIERAVGPADSTKNDGRDVQSMSSRPSRTGARRDVALYAAIEKSNGVGSISDSASSS